MRRLGLARNTSSGDDVTVRRHSSARLEAENRVLRAALAAAKVEIAELAGERDELRHEVNLLRKQAGKASMLWPFARSDSSESCTAGESSSSAVAMKGVSPPAAVKAALKQGPAQKLFAKFSDPMLDAVVAGMTEQHFESGDVVVRQGEPGR